MKVYFYGAGMGGENALKKWNDFDGKKDEFVGFIDSYKTGTYKNYPIYSLDEIELKNAILVITVKNAGNAYAIWNIIKQKVCNKTYWFLDKQSQKNIQDFFHDECMDASMFVGEILPYAEMHIMDGCNLNCKGCTHFSPLFRKEIPSMSSRIADVKMLKSKFDNILEFAILGGEPLLNPELAAYIREIRDILPNTFIKLVTNGLLMPTLNERTFRTIAENKVFVVISEYKSTVNIKSEITELLEKYGILYEIREKTDKFSKPLSLTANSKYPRKCISQNCVNVWNGMLSKCPTLMYVSKFNERFGTKLPEDGTIRLDECISGKEISRRLNEKVPLCNYCIDFQVEWEQCNIHDVKREDFAVDD